MSAALTVDVGRHPDRSVTPRVRTITRVPAEQTARDDPASAAIARVAAGDREAFAEFYDLVAPVVFGVIVRVLRDRAQAEEVTQEVFVELWRTAARFDPERGSARTWATTIAHRRAVDRVRSEQAARNREAVDAMRADARDDDVSDRVTAEADRQQVADAMGELTAVQRDAVTLAFYGGLTYREVAVRLGIPEGTAKTRIRDGLNRLRDLMGVTS